MKLCLILFAVLLSFATVKAQNNFSLTEIENISKETSKIAKSLDLLNKQLKNFSETFSANQGLRLSERQQKLLAAFEYLNRAEQRLATLQLLKINLFEKQSSIKVKISEVEDGLRLESVDRSVALRGTTNAEELRSNRRQLLNKERTELNSLLNEIQNTILEIDQEIRQTENFLKNIRQRIFPNIEKELENL